MNELKKFGARLGMLGALAMTQDGCVNEKESPEKKAQEEYAATLGKKLDVLHIDGEEKSREKIPAAVIELADAKWKEKAVDALLENSKWSNTQAAFDVLGEILEALTADDINIILEQQPEGNTGIPELLRDMFIDGNKQISDMQRYADHSSGAKGNAPYLLPVDADMAEKIKKIRAIQEKIALVLREIGQNK